MQIQDYDRQLVAVAFCAIQFFVAIFVEESAVVETRERVGGLIDLQLLEFVVLHQDGNAQKIRGGQYVHQRRLQRYTFAQIFGELAPAQQDAFPIVIALRVGEINLRDGAKELPEKLSANRFVEPVQSLHQEIQERVFGR